MTHDMLIHRAVDTLTNFITEEKFRGQLGKSVNTNNVLLPEGDVSKDMVRWDICTEAMRWDLLNPGMPNLIPIQVYTKPLKSMKTIGETYNCIITALFDLQTERLALCFKQETDIEKGTKTSATYDYKANDWVTPDEMTMKALDRLESFRAYRMLSDNMQNEKQSDQELVRDSMAELLGMDSTQLVRI